MKRMSLRVIPLACVLSLVTLAAATARADGVQTVTLACRAADVLTYGSPGTNSDAALWQVTINLNTSAFTSGEGVMMYSYEPGDPTGSAQTCLYMLNTSSSSFATADNGSKQTLVWTLATKPTQPSGCTKTFTDHVYLLNGLIIDDDLEADGIAGSGVCKTESQPPSPW